jgi:hypothetical protein
MRKFAIFLLLVFLFASCEFACEFETENDFRRVEVQRVQLATPDTYFPTDLRIRLKNTGDSPIDTVRFKATYKSPNSQRKYWTRLVDCPTENLNPGEVWQGKCYFDGNPPEKRNYPNASVFLQPAVIQ